MRGDEATQLDASKLQLPPHGSSRGWCFEKEKRDPRHVVRKPLERLGEKAICDLRWNCSLKMRHSLHEMYC